MKWVSMMVGLIRRESRITMLKELKLVKPNTSFKESYMKGLDVCEKEGLGQSWIYLHESEVDIVYKDFDAYISKILGYEFVPHERFVKGVTFWAILDGEIVGRLGIRLELTEDLKKFGGHIGYIVRPSFRRKGIASKMLALALETDYAKEIRKILLTCDLDNEASEKTIVKNGGVFYDVVELENRSDKKRFWINL
jgi:predicted acetyltransferase